MFSRQLNTNFNTISIISKHPWHAYMFIWKQLIWPAHLDLTLDLTATSDLQRESCGNGLNPTILKTLRRFEFKLYLILGGSLYNLPPSRRLSITFRQNFFRTTSFLSIQTYLTHSEKVSSYYYYNFWNYDYERFLNGGTYRITILRSK